MTAATDYVGVSVFSGVGGLELGFELAGIPTAVQIEKDEQATRVLEARFPDAVRFGDVTEVDVEQVRAVVGDRRVGCLYGGFPCQDVSVAGRRAGMAGERSSLYVELVRLADGLDPEWLVVENVPGLLSADVDPDANGGAECAAAGPTCGHAVRPETGTPHGLGRGTAFAVVLGDITGYRPPVPGGGWRNSGVCAGPRRTVAWRVLDARHFGVAQRRRRVFLVACARDRSAPAAVLLEPEGMRGDPPPGEPPRPRFAVIPALAAVAAGAGAPDAGGAGDPAAGILADEGVTQALTTGLSTGGADAQHAHAGWMVPTEEGARMQPNEEIGALTASGGPSRLDDQSTTQLVVGEPTPLLEVNARTGRSTDDVSCGIGIGGEGDPMFTLQAGKQHGVAYEIDKERGIPNAEGIVVRETDIAPTIVAEQSEQTDRGLRIVDPQAFRKQRRAADPTDDETWVEGDVANTLNQFDGGDTRATEVVVEALGFSEGGTGQAVDTVAPTLTAAQASESSSRQQAVVAGYDMQNDALTGDLAPTLQAEAQKRQNRGAGVVEPAALASQSHVHHTSDGVSPAVTSSKEGPGSVAVPIGQDALRGEGTAKTPSPDAEGRVRLRDPGLGVGDDGDPAQTLTAAGPGAVGTGATSLIEGAHGVTGDDLTGAVQGPGGKPGQGYQAAAVGALVRRLTPTECERLQGFPDEWAKVAGSSDSSRYKEMGNAVCAAVSMWLAWRIQAYRAGWRPVAA